MCRRNPSLVNVDRMAEADVQGRNWSQSTAAVEECEASEGFEYKGICYIPVLKKPGPSTSGPTNRDHNP
jgi:hypothetical protein